MSIEVMKQALEALKTAQNNLAPSKSSAHSYGDGELWDFYEDAITSLSQAIAEAQKQEQDEPVAWMYKDGSISFVNAGGYEIPLYTHPQPKQEWVGLTDEEREEIRKTGEKWGWEDMLVEHEFKLKEKNGIGEQK